MLIKIGGNDCPVDDDDVPFCCCGGCSCSPSLLAAFPGCTGTGAQVPSGVRISRPGWPGRWKRSVMLP